MGNTGPRHPHGDNGGGGRRPRDVRSTLGVVRRLLRSVRCSVWASAGEVIDRGGETSTLVSHVRGTLVGWMTRVARTRAVLLFF